MANAYLLRRGGYSVSSYFNAFTNTENPLSDGGAWRTSVNYYKAPQCGSGKCFANGNTDNFDDAIGQLVSPALGDNYRIGAHVFRAASYTPGVSHEIGLYLRVLIDNSNPSNTLIRGYECLNPYNSGAFQIFRWEGVNHAFPDNFTQLSVTALNGGLQPIQNGDFLEAQIIGSVITCYQNGTAIATATDTVWASGGGPGIGFYANTGATPANFCITDYRADAL